MTPGQLLAGALRRDGARPLLTWYDDATGERIELSVATTANWAAKTANHLVDEHGLDVGDRITLAPASHWLSVVVLLGAWTAGLSVDLTAAGDEIALPGDLAVFMPAVIAQPDALLVTPADDSAVGLVTADRSWRLDELVAAAGAPPRHSRVLSIRPLDSVEAIVDAVVTPLVCDGSAMLVTNADRGRLTARAAAERVTHTAGIDIAGVPSISR